MKQVDGMLVVLVGILAVVAFLNHGSLKLGADSTGATFGVGYGSR